jgi:hypothetical protein
MARSKRAGKAHVSSYARYKTGNTEAINRLRKLNLLVKQQPNNTQLPIAVKNIHHRRHTPKTPYWSSSMIRVAKLIKHFTGKFDKNMFSSDPIVFAAATRTRNDNKFKGLNTKNPTGSMFSMKERAVWKS